MKQLTEPYKFTGTNGSSIRQAFEIEPSDVGDKADNYLGFNHRVYTFTAGDVGRIIERIAPLVPLWSFASKEWAIKALTAQLKETADHTTKACLESEIERLTPPALTKRLSWRTKQDQFFQSAGCGQTHTIKFMGTCESCRRSVYSHGCAGERHCGDSAKDSPDPRGVIPAEHCMNLYLASEYRLKGRDILTCAACADDGDKYRAIIAQAKSKGIWIAPNVTGYLCGVCGKSGPEHRHYDATDPNTHKFVCGEEITQ